MTKAFVKLMARLAVVALATRGVSNAGEVQIGNAFVRGSADGQSWIIGTKAAELEFAYQADQCQIVSFKNKTVDPPREYVAKDTVLPTFVLQNNLYPDKFTVKPVWSKYLPFGATADLITDNLRLTVRQDDLIGFAVGPHGDYHGDQIKWITSVEYADGDQYVSTQDTNLAQGPIWYYYIHKPGTGFLKLVDSVEYQSNAREQVRIPGATSGFRAPGDVPHIGRTMMHPSDQFEAVRVWKAPKDGTVTLGGLAQHERGYSDVDLTIFRIKEKAEDSGTDITNTGWSLENAVARKVTAGGRPAVQLDLTLQSKPLRARLHVRAYPHASVFRQWAGN